MRPSVLTVCVLILVVCFILIWQTSFRPASFRAGAVDNSEPKASPPVSRNEPPLDASAAKAAAQPAPAWETRFWEIASRGGPLQSDDLELLAGTIPGDQIQAALDRLAVDQSGPAMTLIGFLARRWAANSPAEAAQWAATHLADNDLSHDVFAKIMLPWAVKDLAGAAAWVQQLPAGGNKTAAVLSLATEAATQKEGVTAITLAASLPPGSERNDLLNYSAQQWATTDRDGAVTWINQVEDPQLREKMLGEVAVNLGVQDPFAAAQLIATAMPAGQDQDNATVSVVRFWAASAPADAAAWVEQFPEGLLRNAAIENLIDVWGQDDLSQAGAWLDGLPASPSRDAAAKIYAAIPAASASDDGYH